MSATNRQESMAQGQDVLQQVLTRSATDPGFRQQLLESPRDALSDYADIPDEFDVVFVENQADATVVLPDPVDPAAELSEAELEAVAGGSSGACIFATIMGTIAIAETIKRIGDDDAWLS